MNRRLIDTVADSVNIWLNGLVKEGHLFGGRVEFRADENPETSLMAGKMQLHLFLTPPSPAQEIEFVLEYDVGYIKAALAA
jgi:phage tail sheath protein FI